MQIPLTSLTLPPIPILITLAAIVGPIAIEKIHAQDRAIIDKPSITAQIQRERGNITDTAGIIAFRVDGISYDLTSPSPVRFDSTRDWLKTLEIVIQNKSSKNIVAALSQITCGEPGWGRSRPPTVFLSVTTGRVPKRFLGPRASASLIEKTEAADPISVPPGGQFSSTVARDATKMARPDAPPDPDATECYIGLRIVHFSDGTMWQPSMQFFKPDPTSAYGYIKASADEFGVPPLPQ